MEANSIVTVLSLLFGVGSIGYMIVDKLVISKKDEADVNDKQAETTIKLLEAAKIQIEFLSKQVDDLQKQVTSLKEQLNGKEGQNDK